MKTIEDVMICPYCDSDNCYEFSSDEIDFSNENAHYITDCACSNCGNTFRLYMKFKYEITEAHTSK